MQVEDVKTVIIDGKLWFDGKDIVSILGYKNFGDTIYQYINKEDTMTQFINTRFFGIDNRYKFITLINKHGVEDLVSRSTLPNALDIAKKLGINIKVNRKRKEDI